MSEEMSENKDKAEDMKHIMKAWYSQFAEK